MAAAVTVTAAAAGATIRAAAEARSTRRVTRRAARPRVGPLKGANSRVAVRRRFGSTRG
jgi:hypothetical protein